MSCIQKGAYFNQFFQQSFTYFQFQLFELRYVYTCVYCYTFVYCQHNFYQFTSSTELYQARIRKMLMGTSMSKFILSKTVINYSVLNYVSRVPSCPTCLACLRTFASYFPSFFYLPYALSFFFKCLQFYYVLYVPSFFTCLTYLHF